MIVFLKLAHITGEVGAAEGAHMQRNYHPARVPHATAASAAREAVTLALKLLWRCLPTPHAHARGAVDRRAHAHARGIVVSASLHGERRGRTKKIGVKLMDNARC